MGEMADLALSDMMDLDELQQNHADFQDAVQAGVEEVLYDYSGARFPHVFSRITSMATVTKQRTSDKKRPAPKPSIVDQIADIELPDTGIKTLFYGRSGTGKTSLACTYPKPLLLIGTEDGRRSVHNVKGVKYIQVTESSQLNDLVDHVRDGGEYKSAVLDTASVLQDIRLKEIAGEDLPEQLGFGAVSRDHWGQCTLDMKELLKRFLAVADTGVNAVVLAQEREFTAEEGSELLVPNVMAALSPSVSAWLNPAVDYIGQTFLKLEKTRTKVKVKGTNKVLTKVEEKVVYCLRTGPHPVYATKFRLPRGSVLPEYVIDPKYEDIERIIAGKWGKE